ncbi:PDZ domain-containing protein [Thiolapillus sp.]
MKKQNLILCMLAALSLPAAAVLQAEEASPSYGEQQQQSVAPVYLGVIVGPVPWAVQAQLPEDITHGQGLMVMRVMPGSPAALAGLKPHDVLLTFNGKILISPEDLVNSVRNTKAGEKSRVQILRHGKVTDIDVTMASPEKNQLAPIRPWGFPHQMAPQPGYPPVPGAEVRIQENFQAMAVSKLPDGKYKAMIEFLDQDGITKKFEYEGSLDELREQIKKEKELPEPQKQQLLGALNGNTQGLPMQGFPVFPNMQDPGWGFFSPPPWARPYWPSFWD